MPDPASTATAAIHGASLGGSLIIAIGAQNAFVLRQGLARDRAPLVAAVCSLIDAALIVAGVAGLGRIVTDNPGFIGPLAWFGVVFLTAYGGRALIRAAGASHALLAATRSPEPTPTSTLLLTTLAISLLNPHVYHRRPDRQRRRPVSRPQPGRLWCRGGFRLRYLVFWPRRRRPLPSALVRPARRLAHPRPPHRRRHVYHCRPPGPPAVGPLTGLTAFCVPLEWLIANRVRNQRLAD